MRSVLLFSCLLAASLLQADEPAPIQQWIDEAMKAGGGVVTIPEGVHVLAKGLIIREGKKLALRGVDRENCVLKLSEAAAKKGEVVLEIRDGGEVLEIAGLTLRGSEAANTLIRVRGREDQPVNDLVIRDCLFESFGLQGVNCTWAQQVTVERCSFRDGGQAAIHYGPEAASGTFRGNPIIRCHTGIVLDHAAPCLLVGNEIREGTHGVRILGHEKAAKAKTGHGIRQNTFSKLSGGGIQRDDDALPPELSDNAEE